MIQYRLTGAKKEPDLVNGPDDADVVVSLPKELVGTNLTVAFMHGKLKSTGPTGPLLAALRDGDARAGFDTIDLGS
jgi:hypothetical protein